MFRKGAKLIESTWYPIKMDFVPKMEATDNETGAISQETREVFAEENEVEVNLMRWLGRPKEYAAHASAVANSRQRSRWKGYSRNKQMVRRCTYSVAW